MNESKHSGEFALLFFPKRGGEKYIMYLPTPPPVWLNSSDMTKITVCEPGVYCIFFLAFSGRSGRAYLAVNGKVIKGSETRARRGSVSGSAVCSIREKALPCELSIMTDGNTSDGILLVTKHKI